MENKELKQPIPEELKDEQLNVVTGGSTIMDPTTDIETTATDIVMAHGISLLDLITTPSTDVVRETYEKIDALSPAHSALDAYRNEVQMPADEHVLPSELQLRKKGE